ncbi:response regulator [Paenibacillus lutrae]|uniref:Response regulator n=1 Tax=Paenibacillus lutrae TaxID=2078573 RepID=A0A7X3FJQ7_9BACL|nr:response regulator [Paenibacillus lutrae]MVP00988.1 response regulator [Paenibacillus lutrae]
MKVIIVDDEKLALRKIEKLLGDQEGLNTEIELVGAYQDPVEALEAVQRETPDIDLAFLDIEMPEMNGFELAERLLALYPQLQVVFVTAYHSFAVKAFEVDALDYLLKPVHPSRLSVTLKRAAAGLAVPAGSDRENRTGTMLCCLRSLHYLDTGGQRQYFSWKTLKAPELFAYLIHHRDRTVGKQTLIDLLWPDYDFKRATAQLHTAVYQIRKMIRSCALDITVKYQDEAYRLLWGNTTLDVEEWEKSLQAAPPVMPDTLELHVNMLDQYTGDYLEEHWYSWSDYEQERLRLLWLQHAKQVAECRAGLGHYPEAIGLYQIMMEKFPYMEAGYYGLIRIYALLHNTAEVRRIYQLLTDELAKEYGTAPSEELREWYRQWELENPSSLNVQ